MMIFVLIGFVYYLGDILLAWGYDTATLCIQIPLLTSSPKQK